MPKFKFNNWFGSSHVISEVILSLLRCFPAATRANIPFNDTSEAVSDPLIIAPEDLADAALPRQEAQVVVKPTASDKDISHCDYSVMERPLGVPPWDPR